jgi:polysaccharide transporter, PST family
MNLLQSITSLFIKIKNRQDLQNIISNTSWLFADRILRMGVGLFVGVWIARYLGVNQFGIFNYANAFVTMFAAVSTLGLPSLIIRTLTQDPGNVSAVLGTAFLLQLSGGIFSFILSVGAVALLRHGDPLVITIVAILASSSIFQAFDTIDLFFQAQVSSKYTVIAKGTAFLAITGAKVILINTNAPLVAFAWAQMAEVALGAVGLVTINKIQGYSILGWRWSQSLAKALLTESWPLILSGLAILVYLKVDQIMLGEILGSQAVGIYSAAARISEVWYFLPTAIISSLAPAIYTAKKEGNEVLYYRKIEKLLRLLSYIAIAIALPMSLLSGPIIALLFGNAYAEAGPVLAIHIWAALFVFSGVGSSLWFVSEGLTHLAFHQTLIGALVNILLNFLLIPTYSGTGAAIATVISYATGSVFANAINQKTRKIFVLQVKTMLLIF